MPFLHWLDDGSIAIITQWTDKDSIEYEKEALLVDRMVDKILTNSQNQFKELEIKYGPFNTKSKPFFREFAVGNSINRSNLLKHPLVSGDGTKIRPPELLDDKTGNVEKVESGFENLKIGLFTSMGNKAKFGFSQELGTNPDRWSDLRPTGKDKGVKRSGKQDNFSRACYLAEQDIESALLTFGGIVDNVNGFHERLNFTLNLKNAVSEIYKLIPEQERSSYYKRDVTRPMYKKLKSLFPSQGVGSAKQPEHYSEDVLQDTLKNIWKEFLPI